MKIEELQPYLQSLREWLLANGFVIDYEILKDGYSKPFGQGSKLLIYIDIDLFQFVQIKDEDQDKVCLYYSHINGNLSIEYLEQLIKTIYWKNE